MLERLEQRARELEQSGEYRVLRRLTFQDDYAERGEREVFVGVILDTETTGLDVQQADVIELGMIKFEYTPDGDIVRMIETFNQMQQLSGPRAAEQTIAQCSPSTSCLSRRFRVSVADAPVTTDRAKRSSRHS